MLTQTDLTLGELLLADLTLTEKLDLVEELSAQVDALQARLSEIRDAAKQDMQADKLTEAASSSGKVFQLVEWLESDYSAAAYEAIEKAKKVRLFCADPKITRAKVFSFHKKGLIGKALFDRLQAEASKPKTVAILKRKPEPKA